MNIADIINNPKFYHVGLIVKDAESTLQQMSQIFPNISHINKINVKTQDPNDLIVGAPFELICMTFRVDRIAFELVQPVAGRCEDSYQARALSEFGEGFHHVAYVYPKEHFDKVVQNMLDNGYEIAFASKMGGGVRRCFYLAPKDNPGLVVELLDGTAAPIDY